MNLRAVFCAIRSFILARGVLLRLLTSVGMAISITSCGGGADSPSTANSGITVTSVLSDSFKKLTPAQAAGASILSSTSVDIPNDTNLQVGSVLVVGGQAIKLSSIETGAAAGMTRFSFTTPRLDDIYSSIVFNGSFTLDSAELVQPATVHSMAAASSGAATRDSITCKYETIVGYGGRKCKFDFLFPAVPMVSVAGDVGFGGSVEFSNWNAIKNTGSGSISVSFDGSVALSLKSGTSGLLDKGDVCSSTREQIVGARVRLYTFKIRTPQPGIEILLPVCLAGNGKAGVVGTLFSYRQQDVIRVAVGNSAMPKIISSPPANGKADMPPDTEIWTIDSQTTTINNGSVEVAASESVAAELSLEIAATVPGASSPLVSLGLSNSFNSTLGVTGTVSPAVLNIGKTIGAIGFDPLYCLDAGLSVDYKMDIYGDIPAFSGWTGIKLGASKTLFGPAEIYSEKTKLGKCGSRVKTQTTIYTVVAPGNVVHFSVNVAKNDPAAGTLWDDRKPSGTVKLIDANGDLCTITLVDGVGSCSYTYPHLVTTGISLKYLGRYSGDQYFDNSSAEGDATLAPAATGFTKVSAAGLDLPADAVDWACIRQNSTGLLWEAHVIRKTPDHVCAWNLNMTCRGYTNFGDGSQYDASAVPNTVKSLCGRVGWRLPTVDEGRILVEDPLYNSTNIFGFSDTQGTGWTSSPTDNADWAWQIVFTDGSIDGVQRRFDYHTLLGAGVRLVR